MGEIGVWVDGQAGPCIGWCIGAWVHVGGDVMGDYNTAIINGTSPYCCCILESNRFVKLSKQGALGQANQALKPTSLHPKRVTNNSS